MKLKIKFLTVVWGDTYIKNFCELSLPSLMAEGNIPALAQESELEVLIMTREEDFPVFKKYPAFQRLNKQVPVKFVSIDDLIPGNVYGVTLTLAYARPILELKERMLQYHFVFMNADFLLADGSLATLARVLRNGAEVVLAPSLRVIAEETEPTIRKRVDQKKGLLQIPPREFLELGMPHLHPTTLAKTINFKSYHTVHPNQLFWRVDESTLLGRYFLIFMLAIRPKKVIRDISNWCDYGFVPEFCPETPAKVLGNSDEFLMVETQEKTKEKELLRDGSLTPQGVKKSLDEWLTPGHLQNFQHEIIFHTGEIPEKVAKAKNNFKSFLDGIAWRKIRLHSIRNHFYWESGLNCWLKERAKIGMFEKPAELKLKSKIIETVKVLQNKLFFLSNKNKNYSWSPEESIMEPRLALLEKILKENNVLSRPDPIITDHRNIISVLCLLRRNFEKKKCEARVILLSGKNEIDRKYLSSGTQNRTPCFILEELNSDILLFVLKKNLQCRICLLPNHKNQINALHAKIVDLHFLNSKYQIVVKKWPDKTFWHFQKLKNILQAISLDTKNAARLHLKKYLLGYSSEIEGKLKKWKISVPQDLRNEIIKNHHVHKTGKVFRESSLKLGLCKIYLTFPSIDEPIHLPKNKLPLIYRLYPLFYRMFYENNFCERFRSGKTITKANISEDAAVILITLKPKKSLAD